MAKGWKHLKLHSLNMVSCLDRQHGTPFYIAPWDVFCWLIGDLTEYATGVGVGVGIERDGVTVSSLRLIANVRVLP